MAPRIDSLVNSHNMLVATLQQGSQDQTESLSDIRGFTAELLEYSGEIRECTNTTKGYIEALTDQHTDKNSPFATRRGDLAKSEMCDALDELAQDGDDKPARVVKHTNEARRVLREPL